MAERQELEIPGVGHPQPFSHGVRVGNVIFTSGIDPIDPATGKPGDTIERQAELLFQNLGTLLKAGGATLANVGQVTVYMQDPGQRAALNTEWVKAFPEGTVRPARKTIKFDFGTSGILIQIQVIAVV